MPAQYYENCHDYLKQEKFEKLSPAENNLRRNNN